MISTLTFDVKATMNTLFSNIIGDIETEVNAALSPIPPYAISVLTHLPVISYPSFVISWPEVDSPAENRRKYAFVNVALFTKSSPDNPDDRLPSILESSFLDKLSFKSRLTSDLKWFAINNPDAIANIDQSIRKISLELSHGFRLMSTQEHITHKTCGLVVKYH